MTDNLIIACQQSNKLPVTVECKVSCKWTLIRLSSLGCDIIQLQSNHLHDFTFISLFDTDCGFEPNWFVIINFQPVQWEMPNCPHYYYLQPIKPEWVSIIKWTLMELFRHINITLNASELGLNAFEQAGDMFQRTHEYRSPFNLFECHSPHTYSIIF